MGPIPALVCPLVPTADRLPAPPHLLLGSAGLALSVFYNSLAPKTSELNGL